MSLYLWLNTFTSNPLHLTVELLRLPYYTALLNSHSTSLLFSSLDIYALECQRQRPTQSRKSHRRKRVRYIGRRKTRSERHCHTVKVSQGRKMRIGYGDVCEREDVGMTTEWRRGSGGLWKGMRVSTSIITSIVFPKQDERSMNNQRFGER